MKPNSTAPEGAHPTETEIRELAYHLYEKGGCTPGRELEHWLEAEAHLRKRPPAPREVPPQWNWHYKRLLHIREVLQNEHTERGQAVRAPLERGGTDPVDVANSAVERVTLLAELSQEAAELAEVEAALERILRGTYGICEMTGKPVEPERLRALPWTRLSRAAAETIKPGR